MFSLFSLTAFFHATNFLYHDCFFAAFLSGNSLLRCCTANATDSRGFFLLIGDFTLHFFQFAIVPRVLRIWERFFCSEAFFTLNSSFPTFGTTCFYQGFPENRMFFFEDCRVSHWETQTRPIFLFESHSVQQKVLLGRFHLCIKALQSTISTSSRLWTHYLLSTYIKMCMSYSLDQRIY